MTPLQEHFLLLARYNHWATERLLTQHPPAPSWTWCG